MCHWVAGALLLLPIIGCERPPGPGSKPKLGGSLIALIGPYADHPRWAGVRGGGESLLRTIPNLRSLSMAPREAAPSALRATVLAALEHRPNAVCLFIDDAEYAADAARAVLDSQTILVTMGERFEHPQVSSHIGVDWISGAEQLGSHLDRLMKDRRAYLLLSDQREPWKTCVVRFRSAIERKYELSCLQDVDVSTAQKPLEEVLLQALDTFPNAAALVSLCPQAWPDASTALRRRILSVYPDLKFVLLGGAPNVWPELGTSDKPGPVAGAACPLDGELGRAGVEEALRLLLNASGEVGARTVGCVLVTADTLAEFRERYAAAANGAAEAASAPEPATRATAPPR